MDFLISSFTSQLVDKAMDGVVMRHTAIASNLANVDTPGYQHRQVAFEGDLQRAIGKFRGKADGMTIASNDVELGMQASNPLHLSPTPIFNSLDEITPRITSTSDTAYRNDGNNVDVEHEMVDLARNTEHFLALARLNRQIDDGLRKVISSSGS
jgi:flagellar basal-body rod protein FlgB